MFYNKLILVAVLMLTATLAQAQPNVPISDVDTLCYLGKGIAGEAGGAFFLPDGNIIALWKGIPTVIDSKTGTIIRNLEELPNQNVDFPALSADGRYFVAYSKKGTAIWDVNTGKVIKFITVANGYAFSPDGSKMYCTAENDSKDPGIIIEYDMNTLERIDRFCHDDFKAGDHIAISPDGQTLAVSLYKPQDNPYDEKTNQVILIDLKDKTKYTVLETLEPTIKSMEFSPDGKQLTFVYNGGNGNVYIYI
jgi:WD40 repeat protein